MSPYHPSCPSPFRLRALFAFIATVVLSVTALAQSWNLPASPVTGTYYGISFTTAASNHGNTITIYVQAPGSSTWNGHGGGGGSPTAPITASGGITFSAVGTWTFKAVNGSSSGSTTLSTATRTVTASSTAVSFSFGNLSHTYDGNTKTASVSPDPANATYTADLTKGPGVGSYTVTASGTGSFTGSGSATLTISASGQSSVGISPGSGSVSTGQSLTFTASGGSGSGAYVWGGDASGSGGSQSVTFNTAGTRYVTVYRQGDGGYGQSNTATATISVSVPDTTPPNPPANPQISSLTASSFVLSWTAPSGEAATGYRVRLGSGSFTEIGNVLSHTFSGLSSGTAYTAQVQARDAAGNWSASASYAATTSGSSGGGGSASTVFWMDTNSDGILDQVTGSNSPQFYYYIDWWTTTNTGYSGPSINSWLAAVDNIFSQTTYDDYTRWWQPSYSFWIGHTTHFSVNFKVETDADRPQKIYVDYSRLTDINRNRWYLLFDLPGFSTGGWHNIYHSIVDPGPFDRAQYFLVEEGRPIASAKIKDSAGNVIVSNAGPNQGTPIAIPADGQIEVVPLDDDGQEIAVGGGGHALEWIVNHTASAVNALAQGAGKVVDLINVLPLGNGQVMVGFKQDNDDYIWIPLVLQNTPPQIRFTADAGKIHWGFDPPNAAENDTPNVYWASVIRGQSNTILNLDAGTAAWAQSVRLRIDQADTAYLQLNQSSSTQIEFTNAVTDLMIGSLNAGGPGIREVPVYLEDKVTGKLRAKLNVMVLPLRTLEVGIYTLEDSNSPATQFATAPAITPPSSHATIEVLNDVFKQAGVQFTKHPSSGAKYFAYDTTMNGKMEPAEHDAMHLGPYDALFPLPWTRRIYYMRRSGYPYPSPYESLMARGMQSGNIFVHDTRGWSSIAAAHEMGHKLALKFPLNADIDHEAPPYPPGVDGNNPHGTTPQSANAGDKATPEYAVMASGAPQNVSGQALLPWLHGRWMRHESWSLGNTNAATGN